MLHSGFHEYEEEKLRITACFRQENATFSFTNPEHTIKCSPVSTQWRTESTEIASDDFMITYVAAKTMI